MTNAKETKILLLDICLFGLGLLKTSSVTGGVVLLLLLPHLATACRTVGAKICVFVSQLILWEWFRCFLQKDILQWPCSFVFCARMQSIDAVLPVAASAAFSVSTIQCFSHPTQLISSNNEWHESIWRRQKEEGHKKSSKNPAPTHFQAAARLLKKNHLTLRVTLKLFQRKKLPFRHRRSLHGLFHPPSPRKTWLPPPLNFPPSKNAFGIHDAMGWFK